MKEVQARVLDSAQYLNANLARVPAMLIPCASGRLDDPNLPLGHAAGAYGSIIPAVWSFMLAARERGLGTAWTTIHLMHEQEAADVLGIDYEEVSQIALVTIGYTKGTDFKPAKRPPLETVVHWDTWGSRA